MMLVDMLRGRMRLFVLEYLSNGFNGTQAARAAGYKGDNRTLGVTAHRLLKNDKIAAAIREYMQDVAMSADEALARLAMMARGDLGDFAGLSEDGLAAHPQSMLLHTVKRRTIPQRGGEPIVELEYRLYDAQAALVQILKQQNLAAGLPTERVAVDDWRSEVIGLLRRGEVTAQDIRDELGDEQAEELFNAAGIRTDAGRAGTADAGTGAGAFGGAEPSLAEPE